MSHEYICGNRLFLLTRASLGAYLEYRSTGKVVYIEPEMTFEELLQDIEVNPQSYKEAYFPD